jgi:hypothetical protein
LRHTLFDDGSLHRVSPLNNLITGNKCMQLFPRIILDAIESRSLCSHWTIRGRCRNGRVNARTRYFTCHQCHDGWCNLMVILLVCQFQPCNPSTWRDVMVRRTCPFRKTIFHHGHCVDTSPLCWGSPSTMIRRVPRKTLVSNRLVKTNFKTQRNENLFWFGIQILRNTICFPVEVRQEKVNKWLFVLLVSQVQSQWNTSGKRLNVRMSYLFAQATTIKSWHIDAPGGCF